MYEDYTGVDIVPGVLTKPRRTEVFDWELGVIDGERHPAAPHDAPRSLTSRRSDDDDADRDGDRDRRSRDRSRGWRDTIRRSLSRSARPRDDEGRRGGGRERERSSNLESGRRHAAQADAALLDKDVEVLLAQEDAPISSDDGEADDRSSPA